MADTIVGIDTASTSASAPVRVLSGLGAGVGDQQVVTVARQDGTLEAATAAGSIAVQTRVQALSLTSNTISSATGSVVATTDIPSAGSVTVVIIGGATGPSGLVLNFEASPDGTNWAPVIAQRTDTFDVIQGTTQPFSLATGAVRAWDVPLPGFAQFRVRASALTAGSIAVVIAPAVNPFEIAPSVGVSAYPKLEVTPANATTVSTIVSMDVSAYTSFSLQLIQVVAWVGVTVIAEVSNDNTNWTAVLLTAAASTGVATSSVSFTGLFYGHLGGARYMRYRVSGITSGTVGSVLELSAAPQSYPIVGSTLTNATGAAALADGFANPSVGHLAGDAFVFNGTTWDRTRGNWTTTTGDTGAKTTTFNGAAQTNFNARGAAIILNIGTVSGTSPTLVAKVQGSADGGTTWYDIPGATTASLVATGVFGITVYPGATVLAGSTTSGTTAVASNALPRTWRLVYTIGGTTPSFTLTNVQVAYIV